MWVWYRKPFSTKTNLSITLRHRKKKKGLTVPLPFPRYQTFATYALPKHKQHYNFQRASSEPWHCLDSSWDRIFRRLELSTTSNFASFTLGSPGFTHQQKAAKDRKYSEKFLNSLKLIKKNLEQRLSYKTFFAYAIFELMSALHDRSCNFILSSTPEKKNFREISLKQKGFEPVTTTEKKKGTNYKFTKFCKLKTISKC